LAVLFKKKLALKNWPVDHTSKRCKNTALSRCTIFEKLGKPQTRACRTFEQKFGRQVLSRWLCVLAEEKRRLCVCEQEKKGAAALTICISFKKKALSHYF